MPRRAPLTHWLKSHLPFNRQTYLRDVSVMAPRWRRPGSDIIQFYSSYRNIGNFLPVLGIQQMLGRSTDVWDIHQTPVDWEFVHRNYRAAIIGGAGLLHACFEPFWEDFASHGRLPYIIWGIGVCLPANESAQGVSVPVARAVFSGARLANIRDLLTRDHYGLGPDVDIAVCPTVNYLHALRARRPDVFTNAPRRHDVLHSIHTSLSGDVETERINALIRASGRTLACTANLQRYRCGIEDVLEQYAQTGLVVSTRLHGAIIAFGLDVPYIALSFDPKIRAFVTLYGGGTLCESIEDLANHLQRGLPATGSTGAAQRSAEFGRRAQTVLNELS